MKKISRTFLLLILSVSFANAQDEKVDLQMITKIKEEGFNNSKVMETVFNLTDVNGPRLTGSAGLKHAEEWTRKQLEDWGLQNAKLERWGTFGKGWEVRKCYIAMTVPYYQALIAVPKAWTSGTDGLIKGSPVLVRVDSVSDFEKYKGKLKGKIVVISASTEIKANFEPDAKRYADEELENIFTDPNFEDTHGKNLERTPAEMAQLRTARLLRGKLNTFLAEEGVALILTGKGSMGTLFTTNGASFAMNGKPIVPELEMSAEHVNRIIRLLEAKKEVQVEAEIATEFSSADSTEYNVIAEIPGTDKTLKSELVMLGGHLDCWHAGTGATDNAAGVAVTMEAVRILNAIGVKPRRTIRIALWSGEEQGLYGSKNYVKNHFGDRDSMKLKPEHDKLSAYFNLDNGAGRIRGIYLQGNDALRPVFQAWLEPFKDMGAATVTARNTGSTDHVPFDAIGLPGFQFIQDPIDYKTRTHHTNMDTYDRVQKNDLIQASVIVASFVYNTAMGDQKLIRKPLPKPKSKSGTGM